MSTQDIKPLSKPKLSEVSEVSDTKKTIDKEFAYKTLSEALNGNARAAFSLPEAELANRCYLFFLGRPQLSEELEKEITKEKVLSLTMELLNLAQSKKLLTLEEASLYLYCLVFLNSDKSS